MYLRGQQIPFSPEAINRLYRLPDIPNDPYQRLLQRGIDTGHLILCLTGERQELGPAWRHLKREVLTAQAKVWYYFVAARLMPTVTNSEVRRERAYLTYALFRGIRVDVGQLIYSEMTESMTTSQSHMSLGFPALIYSLAQAVGVSITPNPATRIPVQKVITLQLFQSGGQPRREHAQRDQHSPEPLDANDDDEQDDQTESTGGPSSSSSQGRRTLIQRMDSLEQNMATL